MACFHHYALHLHGPRLNSSSPSIAITNTHTIKGVRSLHLSQVHGVPQRDAIQLTRGGKQLASGGSDSEPSFSAITLEESVEKGRTKRRVGDSVPHGKGSGTDNRKEEHGSKNSDHTRNGEVGTAGFNPSQVSESNTNGKIASSNSEAGGVGSKSIGSTDASKKGKEGKKTKVTPPETELRIGLDMCSKKGDVLGALSLYDSAVRDGVRIEQYHCNVLLYLCSSAAMGGSSNSGSSGFNSEPADGPGNANDSLDSKVGGVCEIDGAIRVSDDVQSYAFKRALEIYRRMCSEEIPFNEAALTSLSRMAMVKNNGDLAFDMVKRMKDLGLTMRLRSYGPALFSFCKNGDVDKAFKVEKHMLECGIQPEEPELAALLKASIMAHRSGEVYYLLHKLRTNVRQVSKSTAELIESWFCGATASKLGKKKSNSEEIARAEDSGGGGWHGLGWLGRGKWVVKHADVDVNGFCQSCGEKLVTIDIDPVETEIFLNSVASIAVQRERDSSFQKFQKWLDYYGPFEAVVDAENVCLSKKGQLIPHMVNAVANGMHQKLQSKRWPLIIVCSSQLHGGKMDKQSKKKLVEKWKNVNAIYATPTGSNDDWYWLYAAVKCKGLIVTNDEMRDHNQILGNGFFSKWRERHQVRFSFQDGSPEFSMPPPYSVVIQESGRGHWHIPISSGKEGETGRTWLCVTRSGPHAVDKQPPLSSKGSGSKKDVETSSSSTQRRQPRKETERANDELCSNAKQSELVTPFKQMLLQEEHARPRSLSALLKRAEKLSGHVIDFHI